jgi:DNA gyrase subunit A
VRTIITNERNGQVIFVRELTDEDEIMLTSREGMVVRIPVKDIRKQGRNTMGVRVMRLNDGDSVVSVAKVVESSDEDDDGSCPSFDENDEESTSDHETVKNESDESDEPHD